MHNCTHLIEKKNITILTITTKKNTQISNNDDFPKNICMECFEKLQQFYQLHVQIEKSDRVLRCSKASITSDSYTKTNGATFQN